jgi:hypothetical protein
VIYFAHAPSVNALKIGRAKDVEKRLRDLFRAYQKVRERT